MPQSFERSTSFAEEALAEYKEGIGTFTEKMPELAEPYHLFTEACFKEGTLSTKIKHLMALSISIVLQDEYCIIYHVERSLNSGAIEEELFEAAGVAAAFGGGAAMSQAVTLLQDAIHEFRQ